MLPDRSPTTGFDSESGAIIRVPLDGGPVTTLASGQVQPSGIAIDATSVYWTTLGAGPDPGAVMKLTPR